MLNNRKNCVIIGCFSVLWISPCYVYIITILYLYIKLSRNLLDVENIYMEVFRFFELIINWVEETELFHILTFQS